MSCMNVVRSMSQLQRLEQLLSESLGVSDRTLAEYILSLSKQGVAQLRQELAEFPPNLIEAITNITSNDGPNRKSSTGKRSSDGDSIESKVEGGIALDSEINTNREYRNRSGENNSTSVNVQSTEPLKSGERSVQSPKHMVRGPDSNRKVADAERSANTTPGITSEKRTLPETSSFQAGEVTLALDRKVPKFLQDESVGLSQFSPVHTHLADPSTAKSWLNMAAKHTTSKLLESVRNKDADVMQMPSNAPQRSGKRRNAEGDVQTASASRKGLPAHGFKDTIVQTIAQNPIVVIVGDTGSGKTTQVPQFMNEAGYSVSGKVIACTQPRRLAAISIAERVAEEMGSLPVGGKVGYTVRFDDTSSDQTEVKYMTDGLLLREIMSDPDVSRYSVIMLDEAHERTLSTDILFALLKDAVVRRPDLRVIITSATLDADRFAVYFGGAPIVRIPGRTFPVAIEYLEEPILDYMEAAIETVKRIHATKVSPGERGDILVFLTGQAEIEQAQTTISKLYPNGDLYAVPVYAAIPSEMQSLIFDPPPDGKRKVVLATNIAETSLTIDGIRYVVDPGFAKVQVWDARKGMGVLKVQPISQAQANQRAGRAGRTAPGVCYRLYTKPSFEQEMPFSTAPEIQRENLGYTVLLLKSMGIDDILNFDFMDKPPRDALVASLEELYLLEAIDENANITEIGRQMVSFPLEPALAKVVVNANAKGKEVLEDVLTIIAMLSMPSVFYRPSHPSKRTEAEKAHQQLYDYSGDHLTLLNVYQKWKSSGGNKKWCDKNFIQFKTLLKVKDALHQLKDIVRKGSKGVSVTGEKSILSQRQRKEEIIKILCSGFFRNIAKRQEGGGARGDYVTMNNDIQVAIHPSSILFRKKPAYVLYTNLILTSKEYMHTVSEVQPEWLLEAAPEIFKREDDDEARKRHRSQTIKPLFDRFAKHENEWRVSQQKQTLRAPRR